MATVAYQGFAIKNNLLEATSDRQIFNNLGGSPLGDDITLFFNNKRNITNLYVDSGNIFGDTIIYDNTTAINPAVYSNKTKLTFNGQTLYVKESNGLNKFKLSTSEDLSTTVSLPLVGFYTRSDEITLENISNFSATRRSTDVNEVQTETLTGYLNQSQGILGSNTPIDLLLSLEGNLDFYKFRRNGAIIKKDSFLSTEKTTIKGYVKIQDVDNVNSFGLTNTSPGLFIYNPITQSGVRAFSSNENPWDDLTAGYLTAETNKIEIGTLRSSNYSSATGYSARDLVLISKGATFMTSFVSTTIITSGAGKNFTHKTPITVNGETYYLCLQQQ